MKRVTSREFRASYTKYDEPIEVFNRLILIGVWFPAGSEATYQPAETTVADAQAKERFRTKPFTPVPKPGRKR